MSSTSSASVSVWFQLFDSTTREPYKNTTSSSVRLSANVAPKVAHFKEAVKAEYLDDLSPLVADDLLVYRNRLDFLEGKGQPLAASFLIDGHGNTDAEQDMLAVVVPSSSNSPSRNTQITSSTEEGPILTRKQRWIELNKILRANAKRSQTTDSKAYIFVSWNQVKNIFNPTDYVQPRRTIDDVQLDFLLNYLSYATVCFQDMTKWMAAKRLFLISPIVICVSGLLNGSVRLVTDEELIGNFVNTRRAFDLMSRCGKKAVCVAEADDYDFEYGMAQELVGYEVAADVKGLDFVYGIYTNGYRWTFLRSLQDKVEREDCMLEFSPEGIERSSLKKIAEKIFAIFSDELNEG